MFFFLYFTLSCVVLHNDMHNRRYIYILVRLERGTESYKVFVVKYGYGLCLTLVGSMRSSQHSL